MICEKCKCNNYSDVKTWGFQQFGVFNLCTPCARLVTEWLCETEMNIKKSLIAFVTGEVK